MHIICIFTSSVLGSTEQGEVLIQPVDSLSQNDRTEAAAGLGIEARTCCKLVRASNPNPAFEARHSETVTARSTL